MQVQVKFKSRNDQKMSIFKNASRIRMIVWLGKDETVISICVRKENNPGRLEVNVYALWRGIRFSLCKIREGQL